MKKLSLIAIAGTAFFAIQACNQGSPDAIKSANESNEVKQDSAENTPGAVTMPVSEADSKFAVEAASGGMMEVQLGELAQQKALNQRVKNFGAMMVRDHTKANNDLKSMAGMKNITLPVAPGEDHMDEIRDLSKKSGSDFDKAYMKLMVDDHKDDISAFEKAEKEAKDSDIQTFANTTLPVLRVHLDSAQAINNALR